MSCDNTREYSPYLSVSFGSPQPPRQPFLTRNLRKAMDARRSQFKSTAYRKRAPKKSDKYRRRISNRMRSRSVPPVAGPFGDPTVRRLNPLRGQTLRVQKTVTYDDTFRVLASASPQSSYAVVFDPSGTYGNSSISNGPIAMPDWTSLKACFDQYKVNSITLNMKHLNTGTVEPDDNQVQLYYRYNYESQVTAPSFDGLASLPGTIVKTFTNTSPSVTYTFYPKCFVTVYNEGLLAAQGREAKEMSWCDVDDPVQLYGFQMVLANGTLPNQFIVFDITYDVTFKYGK